MYSCTYTYRLYTPASSEKSVRRELQDTALTITVNKLLLRELRPLCEDSFQGIAYKGTGRFSLRGNFFHHSCKRVTPFDTKPRFVLRYNLGRGKKKPCRWKFLAPVEVSFSQLQLRVKAHRVRETADRIVG